MNRDNLPPGAIEKCTSCKAEIVFATIAGAKQAKAKPIDVAPDAQGTHRLEPSAQGARSGLRAVLVQPHLAFGRTDLHRLHFATCPTRAQHRRTPATASKGR